MAGELKRMCPPPTAWDDLRRGDEVVYQRTTDVQELTGTVRGMVTEGCSALLVLTNGTKLVKGHAYVRVTSREARPDGVEPQPPTRSEDGETLPPGEGSAAPKEAPEDGTYGKPRRRNLSPHKVELRKRFCDAVSDLLDGSEVFADDAVAEVLARPQFAELAAAGIVLDKKAYLRWRKQFGCRVPDTSGQKRRTGELMAERNAESRGPAEGPPPPPADQGEAAAAVPPEPVAPAAGTPPPGTLRATDGKAWAASVQKYAERIQDIVFPKRTAEQLGFEGRLQRAGSAVARGRRLAEIGERFVDEVEGVLAEGGE